MGFEPVYVTVQVGTGDYLVAAGTFVVLMLMLIVAAIISNK